MSRQNCDELELLVEQARSGDNTAIHDLITRFRPMLLRCARLYVSNDQDGEDLVQETFIKAFGSLDSLSANTSFPGWINRICKNTCIDRTRRSAEKKEIFFTDMTMSDDDMEYEPADIESLRKAEDAYTNEERSSILYRILDTLPEEQRTVLVMKYCDNMTLKDISEQLSLPMSTVTGRFSVAKSKVKTAVESLQKRENIRLYNIAPVPFVIWLLQSEEESQERFISEQQIHSASAVSQYTQTANPSQRTSAGSQIQEAAYRTVTDPAAVQNIAQAAHTASRVSPAVILGIAVGLAGAGGAGYYVYRSFGSGSNPVPENPAVIEPADPARNPEAELVWASDQVFDYAGTENFFMNPDHFNPELHSLVTGYPIGKSNAAYDETFEYSYTPDAVILEKEDGTRAVYNYDGTLLSEPFTGHVQNSPLMGYFLSDEESFSGPSYPVFSEDFRRLEQKDFRWGHGETFCCMYQGAVGYLFMYQMPFYPWHFSLRGPTVFPVMSSYDDSREDPVVLSGYVVLDRTNAVISTAPGPVVGPFVNSFYPSVSSTDYDTYNGYNGHQDLPVAFINGLTGEAITDYIYNDFGWFQDGYCPVMRDGKWTYINTIGQEVTGLLFDSASEVYQGRAYVSFNGTTRILNVPETELSHLGETARRAGDDSGSAAGSYAASADENVLESAAEDNYISLVAEHYGMFYYNYLSAIGNNLVPNMENVTEEFRQVLISRYNRDNYGLIFENDYIHVDMDTYTITKLSPDRIRAEFTVDILNHYTGRTSGQAGVTMRVTMECGSDYNDWQILSSDVLDASAVSGHTMMDITPKG